MRHHYNSLIFKKHVKYKINSDRPYCYISYKSLHHNTINELLVTKILIRYIYTYIDIYTYT